MMKMMRERIAARRIEREVLGEGCTHASEQDRQPEYKPEREGESPVHDFV
jgi:hypothetical protein